MEPVIDLMADVPSKAKSLQLDRYAGGVVRQEVFVTLLNQAALH
jgi:hypothetical protein